MFEICRVVDPHALEAARTLIRAHVEPLSATHDAASVVNLLAALPAPYVPPSGGLWLAWDGSDAVGCIALQQLTVGVAEVKRLYVRPESRGRGVARALVLHAMAEARALGYARLRLGTLNDMHAAQRLYASIGFRQVSPYRATEFGTTLFYELDLRAAAV
jgi:ribosomal protein S18 acetylase RimI-like enzyme